MTMSKCPKCGCEEIDTGRIYSAGPVAYKSRHQKSPFAKANCVSYVCMACGYTESYIEAEYLEKIKRMKSR